MSTIGTYRIDDTLCVNNQDNYPQGAAFHLVNAIEKCGKVDLFSMIRGIDNLRLWEDKDSQPEFHYQINSLEGTIKCYSSNEGNLELQSFGLIEEWINVQMDRYEVFFNKFPRHENAWGEGKSKEDYWVIRLKSGVEGSCSEFSTVAKIKRGIEAKIIQALKYQKLLFVGNANQLISEAKKMAEIIPIDFNEFFVETETAFIKRNAAIDDLVNQMKG